MRYSEIIIYRRTRVFQLDGSSEPGDTLHAYRVSSGQGFSTTRPVNFSELFNGHTAWVGEQVAIANERNNNHNYNKAA